MRRKHTNKPDGLEKTVRDIRQRNAVKKNFNKLKHFRQIATRYDKRDDKFLASIWLASIRIWLPNYEPVT